MEITKYEQDPEIALKEQEKKFPSDIIEKSDEIRLQSNPKYLEMFEGKEFYSTLKYDGSSGTFLIHPETKMAIRVGYDYPLLGSRNIIFEICYAKNGQQWWTDVVPNFSPTCWKEVSDWYELINGKYIRK